VQFWIGWRFHRGAAAALRRGVANMDVLVALGTGGSLLLWLCLSVCLCVYQVGRLLLDAWHRAEPTLPRLIEQASGEPWEGWLGTMPHAQSHQQLGAPPYLSAAQAQTSEP
jgi:hypothetical protein